MAAITEALIYVADKLKAAGVSAAIDPRSLNLPAVWITLAGVHSNRLSGTAALVDVQLYAIARDNGIPHSLKALDELMADVDATLGTTEWDARAVLLPSASPHPLPGLVTTLTLDWSN